MRANLLPNPPERERLWAADLIRALSFPAILIFHSSFALWAPSGLNYIPPQNQLGQILEIYGRTLAFSGFTVLFLSFFLFGFHGEFRANKLARLASLILIFAAVWSLSAEQFPYIWDIYPFLLTALVAIAFTRRMRPEWIAFLSGVVLSLPLWQLAPILNLPPWIKVPVLGECTLRGDLGDWPLLPWTAYPLFAYACGQIARRERERARRITKAEIGAWCAGLALALPWMGKYYVTPLGEEFGCFIFRQSPLTFWAHQLPVFFLLRLSLVACIDVKIKTLFIIRKLPALAVNQAFYLVYFAHYPIAIGLAKLWALQEWDRAPFALASLLIVLIGALELGAIVIWKILPQTKWARRPHAGQQPQDRQLSESLRA